MTVLRAALSLLLILAALPAAAAGATFADLAWRPHPGQRLPLDAPLVDDSGRPSLLGRYFSGKPVVLVLDYLRCKTLCGVTMKSIVTALDALPLDPSRDYQLVAVSIDPRDTPADAAAAKARYLPEFAHHAGAGTGLHFLTGQEEVTRRVAEAAGFPYRYDPVLDQYLHPAGFVIAGPGGAISRYVFDVGASPAELQRDLAAAAAGEAITPLARVLLFCHIQGAPVGRFTLPVIAAFTVANIAAGLCLIAVFAGIRRRRHG
ncbi:MAG TPA: SCO family protein [Stellaceae bacterium]|nr:SCO family protein [Stellaceae bacterium]